jgi:hypothetical protein
VPVAETGLDVRSGGISSGCDILDPHTPSLLAFAWPDPSGPDEPDLPTCQDKPIPINQIRSIFGGIEASRKNQVELRNTVLQR